MLAVFTTPVRGEDTFTAARTPFLITFFRVCVLEIFFVPFFLFMGFFVGFFGPDFLVAVFFSLRAMAYPFCNWTKVLKVSLPDNTPVFRVSPYHLIRNMCLPTDKRGYLQEFPRIVKTNGRWRDILADSEVSTYEAKATKELGRECATW